MSKGGSLVTGGSSTYDGKPHGVSIGGLLKVGAQSHGAAMSAQSDGDEEYKWAEQGETTVDGVDVSYKVAYFDAEGNDIGAVPTMPGQYAALVRFTGDNPDCSGDWVEVITIAKRPVAKPTTYAKTTVFKISKAKGAVTFKKASGDKKITVNKKTGKITVKKGLKKGNAYKVKVKVIASGGKSYKKVTKVVTVTVKVK